jgi:hypothetical protein
MCFNFVYKFVSVHIIVITHVHGINSVKIAIYSSI